MGTCSHRQRVSMIDAPQTPTVAKLRWSKAVRRVIGLIKLRKLWAKLGLALKALKGDESAQTTRLRQVFANLGKYLAAPMRKSLGSHLIRKGGVLHLRV